MALNSVSAFWSLLYFLAILTNRFTGSAVIIIMPGRLCRRLCVSTVTVYIVFKLQWLFVDTLMATEASEWWLSVSVTRPVMQPLTSAASVAR